MSDEKIDRIIATYKPVNGRPGYVWMGVKTIVKEEILREAYKEYFTEKNDKE